MSIQAGTHRLGPGNATLSVHTERAGAAAKAGHDLLLHVTSWEAKLVAGQDGALIGVELSADPGSLRVIEGKGGMQSLGDDDIASIHQTIDDEVLLRQDIRFRSTRIDPAAGGNGFHVEGDLELVMRIRPIACELTLGEDGALHGTAVVTQTDYGMKPYSALFGALKVKDEVRVELEGHLEPQSR